MYRKLILLIIFIAVLFPTTVFAIGAPDSDYQIKVVTKYPDAIVAGDMLYVVYFDLKYTTTPDELVTDTFTGILFDDVPSPGTAAVVDSTTLFTDENPSQGYNEGVFGIYLETAYTFSGNEKLCLEPNSTSFPALAGKRRCTSTIQTITDKTTFQAWVIQTFEDMENKWKKLDVAQGDDFTETDFEDSRISLIIPTGDNRKVLTTGSEGGGENYAVNTIPNVREILPEIFSGGITEVAYLEEVHTDATTSMDTYFAGTELDTDPASSSALMNLSDASNIPIEIIGVVTIMLISSVIAGAVILTTGRSEIGMFSAIMVIQVGAYTGLIPFALAAILAMVGALSLGYIFFYKSSTS